MMKRISKYIREIDKKGWFLILVGTATWSLTMIKSGLVYLFGMGFWGPNGHDGVWHIAIAQSLASGSWQMPIYAGSALQNYHIGFDLLLAVLHKLTFIPIHTLYFQVIPPVLALLIGIFAFKFILSWTKSSRRAWWSVFFLYFGGSFGWIVTLLRDGKVGGESVFWSQQSISTLINPPFALSILLIFAGLNLVNAGLKNKNRKKLMLASFIFGILVQIKIYAGILCLGGLLVAGTWRMLKRKGISLIKVFAGALIVSILIFSPVSSDVGKTIIFKPFWFLETMMSFQDRFYWPKMASAMVNYKLAGNILKGIPAYLVALVIFLVGNLGIRVIGGVWVIRKIRKTKKIKYLDMFILTVIVIGIILPIMFVQSGTPWNTIQFMYYSLVFSGILAGVWLGGFFERSKLSASMIYIIEAAIVLMTVPTTFGTLRNHYLPSRPPAKISNEELEALRFLEEQPDGDVLTLPFDKDKAGAAVDSPPRPLYLYESTAYVSAFSGKPTYLEDEVNLEITGYDWRKRRSEIERFLNTPNQSGALEFLNENNIDYIYWVRELVDGEIGSDQKIVKELYKNNEISIYKVN